jgi:trehalose/maltose hydrolase-like predicted phosphorylase
VNIAIAYNVWQHYMVTGSIEFLRFTGAELLIEIARFWSSIASYNPHIGRYEIHGVMGPDEFHEKYADSEEAGLHNNAYTNVMVAWICDIAPRMLELLPEQRRRSLRGKIGLTDEEVETWRDMSRKMFIPFHEDGEIISQFEGYEQLEELDWDAYRQKYGNIQRLDRILRAEGNDPDRYKLTKQADSVLLFFLFAERELKEIFDRLGYPFTAETVHKNVEYYDRRTSHGSTLSFVAHAGILADLDLKSSWERYLVALESDIGDIQGGTTQEGIHMGVMAGTLDLVQRGYLGTDVADGVLRFGPHPLNNLQGLSFPMQYRGARLQLRLQDGKLTVAAEPDSLNPTVQVGVGEVTRQIQAGQTQDFDV